MFYLTPKQHLRINTQNVLSNIISLYALTMRPASQ